MFGSHFLRLRNEPNPMLVAENGGRRRLLSDQKCQFSGERFIETCIILYMLKINNYTYITSYHTI